MHRSDPTTSPAGSNASLRLSDGTLPARSGFAALILAAAFACLPAVARAQDEGLQAALALQTALEKAIAKCERSVVAIARVSVAAGADDDEADPFRDRRPGLPDRGNPAVTSPDFIPGRFGSGVVIDRNGLILTNYHVVDDDFLRGEGPAPAKVRDRIYVWVAPKRVFRARIKAADPRSDLAVLEIAAADLTAIPFAHLEKVDGLRKGQLVVGLGNPWATARDGSASATWGIVSNISRKPAPQVDKEGREARLLQHFGALIQTDCRLHLGTSGGALLNIHGELIGLTTHAAALPGYDQGVGYAIPLDATFRRIVETLRQGKEVEYGFLGVQPDNLSERERLDGHRGVRILDVRGTPARKARVQEGDVVVDINGKPIHDIDDLMFQVGRLPVGAGVSLTVLRGGREMPLARVALGKYPVVGTKIVTAQAAAWRGLRIDHPQLPQRPAFGMHPLEMMALQDGAAQVVQILPDSPAQRADLRPGMLITHVDGKRVLSPEEFREAVAGKTGAVELRIATRDDDISVPAEK